MPFEPLRFLHVSNVRLDHQIGETVALPPRVASIVMDAARGAFDRVIAAALEQQVDFVLFAGNTFIEAEQSLAARVALLDGFDQLAREGIRVFVVPGAHDPVEAWRSIPDLPDNVRIVGETGRGAVTVKREGKVIAIVGPGLRTAARKPSRPRDRALKSESQRRMPFTVGCLSSDAQAIDANTLGLWSDGQDAEQSAASEFESSTRPRRDGVVDSPVDYLALAGGPVRRTITKRWGIAHDPGSLQGAGLHEPGPRGGTLVDVDADGTVRCDFVPAASVRWERFTLNVDAGTSPGDLVARCRSTLNQFRRESSENTWIFEWVLRGGPAALAAVDDESCRRRLIQEFRDLRITPDADATVHTFALQPDRGDAERRPTDDPLRADYLEALEFAGQLSKDVFANPLMEMAAVDREWSARLASLFDELDTESISAHARRLETVLFRAAAPEGASQ